MVDLRGEFVVTALIFLCPIENSEQKHVQYLKNTRRVRRVGQNNRSMASKLFQNVFGAMGGTIVTESDGWFVIAPFKSSLGFDSRYYYGAYIGFENRFCGIG
jgi:hypothetical protein